MRKIISNLFCVVFSIILVFTICTNIYATPSNDNVAMIEPLIEEMEQMHASYHSQIENLIQENGLAGTYDINDAYRVTMTESLLLTILNDGKDFKDVIADVVQWKLPIVTAAGKPEMLVFLEEDGVISYSGKSSGKTTNIWQITTEGIREAVRNAPVFDGEIDSIQIVHSYLYNTAFVYLDGANSDYLIPYGVHAEETELENGTVYTVSEVIEKFNKCFDEKSMMENPSHNGGASSSHVIIGELTWERLGLFILIAFVFVLAMNLPYMKRKSAVLECHAMIKEKRMEYSNTAQMKYQGDRWNYLLIFVNEQGNKIELFTNEANYVKFQEGDTGKLTYQGDKLIAYDV